MATTNYSAFDANEVPLAALLSPASDKMKVDEMSDASPRVSRDAEPRVDAEGLQEQARKVKATWKSCQMPQGTLILATKWKDASRSISEACRAALQATSLSKATAISEWLADNSSLLHQALKETQTLPETADELPHVVTRGDQRLPRIYAAAEAFLQTVRYQVETASLLVFFEALQEDSPFDDAELSGLSAWLQFVLLERIGAFAGPLVFRRELPAGVNEDAELGLLRCLRALDKFDWTPVFDALSKTEHILREDPAGAYRSMDRESRGRYHRAIAGLAAQSSWSECDIAQEVVRLSRGPHDVVDSRARERRSHVGYYLVDEGQDAVKKVIGYDATLTERILSAIRHRPTFSYLATIAVFTCGIFALVFDGSAIAGSTVRRLAMVVLIALLPVMECAIAITNLLVTRLLKPERLARLDFSAGIPQECSTLVAIPILLLSDKQVRQAVKDLEIRYLANRDRNLHFALVTDLPDSLQPFDEKDALTGLCSSLIVELNEKYARRSAGSFVHLNRHRSYNDAEGLWMGWERKRGKMLDLNNFLLNRTDHFPIKAGNLSVLKNIRYVITLDQDTQLTTESARKLVGALAHPLNRAVVDPESGRVVEGYAILQPRVAISIRAARRSRLAAIYSRDSGYDIYTRAVSDVYQDLFGAGIYTGKGIYEVETFQKLLGDRFPCNAILSHDLIEGAHARAGFISDVEVVDDYPSHVSAYSRRKHRWVRGDWQIILWLFPRVPESFGKIVPNPLSAISRWQIFDNLRRSLSEVATFVLLLCGWLVFPHHAMFWTLTAVILTAFPMCLNFLVSVAVAGRRLFAASFWKSAGSDLEGNFVMLFSRLTLLCHQSLIALDAVARTTVRMTVTHRRLLEWETAAQAELQSGKDTMVETYLKWAAPAAIALAGVIARFFPSSLGIALPFLMLWGTSKAYCDWLSLPYPKWRRQIGASDQTALRHMALRTWRFFDEFATEEENWLIPDVVQVAPRVVAHAASTTNLGLQLNAQLAAHDLGFLTVSEFVTAASRTVGTMSRLPTHNGQFYNWYDTRTLQPHMPRFISTVDNGNLVCCLWTLKGACAELESNPLFPAALWQGISAHLDAIEDCLAVDSRSELVRVGIRDLRRRDLLGAPESERLKALPKLRKNVETLEKELASWEPNGDAAWWAKALAGRVRSIEEMVRDFTPWLLPEFFEARHKEDIVSVLPDPKKLTLENIHPALTELYVELAERLTKHEIKGPARAHAVNFSEALSRSLVCAQQLLERLNELGATADRLANAQDFSLSYSPQKALLSIGYDAEAQRQWESHYDLLASEARSAVFVAIAKGDIPQEVWFRLGRNMAFVDQRSVMLSWTGTMFEYLMPSLWMKLYPNTLLEQSARTAVQVQRKYAKARCVPWGISECSSAEMNADGRYGYKAFGVQELALSRLTPEDLVVSPYSAFLALITDGAAGASNLREMQSRGWLGTYGFYDACDFTPSRVEAGNAGEIVACWMAHHQGMILVAAANALNANIMQRRFHAEPMVAATERLLQENPRNATELVAENSNKLDWLKASVPVLNNIWQTALSTPCDKAELPATQRVRETDG